MTRLTLYSKHNCHLCEVMKEVIFSVDREQSNFDFEIEEVNIENDNTLFEKYKETIPVLMINGKLFAKYRLDRDDLVKKLSSMH